MLKELKEYLEANKDEIMYLSLYPKEGSTTISEEAANRCFVTIAGVPEEFKGISEKDFDDLAEVYDWREKRQAYRKCNPNT